MLIRPDDAAVLGGTAVVAGGTVAAGTATHTHELGPILAFVGVLLVAFLTAYFAKRRQDDQFENELKRLTETLDAEDKRLRTTLDDERERLKLQLNHDRELQDLAELRTVVDSCLQNAAVAVDTFHGCKRVATRQGFDEELYGKAYSAFQHSKSPLLLSYVQLAARAQTELASAASDLHAALRASNLNHAVASPDRRKQVWDEIDAKVAEAHGTLANVAASFVSSRLPAG